LNGKESNEKERKREKERERKRARAEERAESLSERIRELSYIAKSLVRKTAVSTFTSHIRSAQTNCKFGGTERRKEGKKERRKEGKKVGK